MLVSSETKRLDAQDCTSSCKIRPIRCVNVGVRANYLLAGRQLRTQPPRTEICSQLCCPTFRFKHVEELANQLVVPQSTLGFAKHRVAGLRFWQSQLIGPGRHQSIVDVDNLQYARQHWDVVAIEAVGISRTVP